MQSTMIREIVMDTEKLRKYAELIARSSLNILPEQEVVVRTAPEQLEFVEMVVEECYRAGASKVTVEWRYDPFTKLAIKYQEEKTLGRVELWERKQLSERTEKLPASVYLDSDDPDGLCGIDSDKWARAQQMRYRIRKTYLDRMENKYQWCVAAVPGKKWAERVFPDVPTEEAVEKLWEAILKCGRADGKDPLQAWKEHNDNLKRRCDWLNSLKLCRLIYKSELTGTDFSVGLLPQMRFMGGADELETPAGKEHHICFNANIPSEEVFTTPRKGDAEGTLVATRPLSYRGVLIENFRIVFRNGKVSEVYAEKNEETLKVMVSMDKGASMLGECALVPYHSPIRDSGILFFNTLLDENASCHMALGDGYSSCLENASAYTPAQARKLGVNQSMIHEDFMIGSPDLSVTGVTEDGRRVPIFVNGDWAE